MGEREYVNAGRVHLTEEELCELLGYPGGKIKYVGWMPEYAEIGIVVQHPSCPLLRAFDTIPKVPIGKGETDST